MASPDGSTNAIAGKSVAVLGARGLLGAWIVRRLLAEGATVSALDLSDDRRIPDLVLGTEHPEGLEWVKGDVTVDEDVRRVVTPTTDAVIYLAGILRPAADQRPMFAMNVTVGGLLRTLDAVRAAGEARGRPATVSFASAGAAYGGKDEYPDGTVTRDSVPKPPSHYGIQRFAAEMTADIYGREHGVFAIGLRPWIVFGPGRERGITAGPSIAMLAAAAHAPYAIRLSGESIFHHAADVADAFVRAAVTPVDRTVTVNIPGETFDVEALVGLIANVEPRARQLITVTGDPLDAPVAVKDDRLAELTGWSATTPIQERITETIQEYRDLIASGRLDPADLLEQ